MPVKMQPTSVILANLGLQPGGAIQMEFTKKCAEHMDRYVPYDEGILSQYTIEDDDKIVYDQEYAQYQYYGIRKDGTHEINPANRNRDKHPLATSYWDEHMKTAEMDDIINDIQKLVNRGGK